MKRAHRMKVEINPLPYGAYTADPVSRYWEQRFREHMAEWTEPTAQAFFQGDYDLPETVNQRHRRELNRGWPVTLLVDPWEYGHWLGWGAHTVAE